MRRPPGSERRRALQRAERLPGESQRARWRRPGGRGESPREAQRGPGPRSTAGSGRGAGAAGGGAGEQGTRALPLRHDASTPEAPRVPSRGPSSSESLQPLPEDASAGRRISFPRRAEPKPGPPHPAPPPQPAPPPPPPEAWTLLLCSSWARIAVSLCLLVSFCPFRVPAASLLSSRLAGLALDSLTVRCLHCPAPGSGALSPALANTRRSRALA